MKSLCLKFEKSKGLSLLIAILLGGFAAYSLLFLDVFQIKKWFWWIIGLSTLGILSLQAKALFLNDVEDLGFYYSRLYGMFVGFFYTSVAFQIMLSFVKGTDMSREFIWLMVIFSTGIYYFLKNSYADLSKTHLIGKILMEKQKKN